MHLKDKQSEHFSTLIMGHAHAVPPNPFHRADVFRQASLASSRRSCQTLGLMNTTLTVIDSFRVTEALQPRLSGLGCGTWFVIDGRFPAAGKLPSRGTSVVISKPSGESVRSHIGGVEVRHGSLALRFTGPEITELPRLSLVVFDEA
jgi:hypothetical protein